MKLCSTSRCKSYPGSCRSAPVAIAAVGRATLLSVTTSWSFVHGTPPAKGVAVGLGSGFRPSSRLLEAWEVGNGHESAVGPMLEESCIRQRQSRFVRRSAINSPPGCVGSSHRTQLGSPASEPSTLLFAARRGPPRRARPFRSTSRQASGR